MVNALENPVGWFDGLKSDYTGVKRSRLKRVQTGLPQSGSHADYHYRSEADYLRLMEIARDFERNDAVVGQGINRLTANVIQGGFTLDVQTGDDDINKHLADLWLEWSTDRSECDASGELSFKRMESLVFRSVIRDGDIFAVPLSNGRLRLYEGHRPRTPGGSRNIVHGILLDGQRRRQTLYLTQDDVSPWATVARHQVRPVPFRDSLGRRQVFQVYNPQRVTQTRGVTACAPIVDMVGMHDDVQFANLVRQQVVSCFAVFRKRELGFDESTNNEREPSVEDGRSILDVAPGMMLRGAPGEDLQGFSPNVPNPQFFEHAFLILSFIAINLDLPVQVLLLDPTKTNFSGWRGAIDQARMRFRQMQEWLVEQFHSEVYRWKVRQWLATDATLQEAFMGGLDVFKHNWHAPAWQYIEPNKDAMADDVIVSRGLNSRRRVLARRGIDYDEMMRERFDELRSEISLSMELASELNTKYKDSGNPVDWREIAAGFLPQRSAATLSGTVDDGGDDEQSDMVA